MDANARRAVTKMMWELEMTIRNYGSTSQGIRQVIDMGRSLRDAAREANGLEEGMREQIFNLLRNAKLLALAQANAEEYLQRLELIEDDLRRVS